MRHTIKQVEGEDDNRTITYQSQVFDAKMKPLTIGARPFITTSVVNVIDGVVELDMMNFVGSSVKTPVFVIANPIFPSFLTRG